MARIAADPESHCAAAAAIAGEHFNHAQVLGRLLDDAREALGARPSRALPRQASAEGAALDRVHDEIRVTRERREAQRAAFERECEAGRAEAATTYRHALNQTRARLRALQREVEALEDRQDETDSTPQLLGARGGTPREA